jgi:hypothetical protein
MKRLILAVVILLMAGCAKNSEDPIEIVEAYFECWNAEDVDCAMALIADDPQLIEIDEAVLLSDRADIRAALEGLFKRTEMRNEISDFEVDGNTVSYNYKLYLNGRETPAYTGRSQAIIENGKIVSEFIIGGYQE